jgi:hypothetical protein
MVLWRNSPQLWTVYEHVHHGFHGPFFVASFYSLTRHNEEILLGLRDLTIVQNPGAHLWNSLKLLYYMWSMLLLLGTIGHYCASFPGPFINSGLPKLLTRHLERSHNTWNTLRNSLLVFGSGAQLSYCLILGLLFFENSPSPPHAPLPHHEALP